VPKLFRRLENMRAESDKEKTWNTFKKKKIFLTSCKKLEKLNNKLKVNREKLNYSTLV
jgi:hypothetical protein